MSKEVKEENSKVQTEDLDFIADCKAAFLEEKMPYANILLFAITAFVVVFIIWAANAKVNEVTRGQGKVIPSGSTKIVQSLEGGILSDIYIEEGQTVEEGQVLLLIDDTAFSANYRENKAGYDNLLAKVARLNAEASESETIDFPQIILDNRQDLVKSETTLFNTRRTSLIRNEEYLSKSLELKRSELDITQPLAETGVVSRVELLRLETAVNDLEGKLLKIRADYMNEVMAQRNETSSKLEQLEESIGAYEDKVKRATIRSPVYGTINKVHINTIGGVIQPGAPIVEIVPLEGSLLVEANINPSDIAFIRPKQKATVKLTAYDFSIYGGLDGTVEQISADTFTNEQGESFYQIKVRTGDRSLRNNDEELSIIPGMVVEVDILTGKKSILDYLLKPLLRARMNAFSER